MLVGSPGVGKTWVGERLKEAYSYIPHDAWIGKDYVGAILVELGHTTKPVLIETPFSMSLILEPLQSAGCQVTPVFIIEPTDVYTARYFNREQKMPPKGHLTRMNTYLQRARNGDHFYGTSSECLAHLISKNTMLAP